MIREQPVTVSVVAGISLQGALAVPADARTGVGIAHPHPLHGGDMDNPVVVRVAEVCQEVGLATLRFNFRGVGASTGRHDEGRGEQADLEAALAHLAGVLGAGARIAAAGYSFGALVAAEVASRHHELAGLALVAPALGLRAPQKPSALAAVGGPVLVAAAGNDEYCPPAALERLRRDLPSATIQVIEGANHFFFGKLYPLGQALATWARRVAQGSAQAT
jgi:alpha/beta superfamily hydrolase